MDVVSPVSTSEIDSKTSKVASEYQDKQKRLRWSKVLLKNERDMGVTNNKIFF